MNTLDLVSITVGAFGVLLTVATVIHQFVQYRVDFPELPFRYGVFRGYKVKKHIVSIAILRNGNASYTKQIRSGFINRAVSVFAKTEYAIQFEDYIGEPYVEGDEKNREIISHILDSDPDLLVTIGSQVSISAKTHFSERIPIIALGLGAPVQSGFIDQEDKRSKESLNIAVVRYGTRIDCRIDFLTKLFEKNKKCLKFVFIANAQAPQDALLAEEVRKIAEERDDIELEVLETQKNELSDDYDNHCNVFFGFYHLNNHLKSYISKSKNAVFLGLNPTDTRSGAIASTGNNDYHLGEIAVDQILVPKIIKRKPFDEMSLIEPKPYYSLNRKIADKRNFRFSRNATKLASEIIDF